MNLFSPSPRRKHPRWYITAIPAFASLAFLVGVACSGGSDENSLSLLPSWIGHFIFVDVAAAKGEGIPFYFADSRAVSVGQLRSGDLEAFGFHFDDIDNMVRALPQKPKRGHYYFVEGDLDHDFLRAEFDANGYQEDEYRGYELWERIAFVEDRYATIGPIGLSGPAAEDVGNDNVRELLRDLEKEDEA